MTTQKLTKRQSDALKDINRFRGSFSVYWRPKSWPVLIDLGLAKKNGPGFVAITEAGIEWLEANQ